MQFAECAQNGSSSGVPSRTVHSAPAFGRIFSSTKAVAPRQKRMHAGPPQSSLVSSRNSVTSFAASNRMHESSGAV